MACYYPLRPFTRGGGGGGLGPFLTGCVNTNSKEMGPFSTSSGWNEWIQMGVILAWSFNMGILPSFPIQYQPYFRL